MVSAWAPAGASRAESGYGASIAGPSRVVYDPTEGSVYIETEAEVIIDEEPPN